MIESVVDSSAILELFTAAQPSRGLRTRFLASGNAAPALLDAEVAHVLRRMARRGELSEQDAHDTLMDIRDSPISRSPHQPLVPRVWELRGSVTAYDAMYIALAEALDVPLLTCDAKLAGSNGHNAKIELFAQD
ncbi:putative nucleic acid-binding protein [Actinoalloteichus hoggarensis]|uniref:Ribonuclease VapC n=1 Tax=Actinoalloteichus hoggarensis TaxID=1470176 RepID=A0A221W1M4_9PSEU|nr:type II toxin-antitoxin system VapC family toxin [Actinoalloteichus hoggarensis]ASO19670.1 Ribonuclease VapC3 [Actinoalloteichus hoggarensis]MBB5919623.1 putative nucleic acid-binding protein [Actinoalloteichus hoggarensis]